MNGVRRFAALLKGLPWEADMRAPEREVAKAPPVEKLRRVSPLEAMAMLKGG